MQYQAVMVAAMSSEESCLSFEGLLQGRHDRAHSLFDTGFSRMANPTGFTQHELVEY